MFNTSEEAMDANEPVTVAAARREMRSHGMEVGGTEVTVGTRTYISVRDRPGAQWELVECRTRPILEWLGY